MSRGKISNRDVVFMKLFFFILFETINFQKGLKRFIKVPLHSNYHLRTICISGVVFIKETRYISLTKIRLGVFRTSTAVEQSSSWQHIQSSCLCQSNQNQNSHSLKFKLKNIYIYINVKIYKAIDFKISLGSFFKFP